VRYTICNALATRDLLNACGLCSRNVQTRLECSIWRPCRVNRPALDSKFVSVLVLVGTRLESASSAISCGFLIVIFVITVMLPSLALSLANGRVCPCAWRVDRGLSSRCELSHRSTSPCRADYSELKNSSTGPADPSLRFSKTRERARLGEDRQHESLCLKLGEPAARVDPILESAGPASHRGRS